MNTSFAKRIVSTQEERLAVYELRYDAYIRELGWSSPYADHERGILTDPFDARASLFAAFEGAQVVATMRTIYSRDSALDYYIALYGMEADLMRHPQGVAVVSALIVRRGHRGSRLVFEITKMAYERVMEDGISIVYLDCEPELADLYGRMGFRRHRDNVRHPDFGIGVCMRLDLDHHPSLWQRASVGRQCQDRVM
jgi:predicted GNAT family N-acyltransferase